MLSIVLISAETNNNTSDMKLSMFILATKNGANYSKLHNKVGGRLTIVLSYKLYSLLKILP